MQEWSDFDLQPGPGHISFLDYQIVDLFITADWQSGVGVWSRWQMTLTRRFRIEMQVAGLIACTVPSPRLSLFHNLESRSFLARYLKFVV
jgi:hypothetical protein